MMKKKNSNLKVARHLLVCLLSCITAFAFGADRDFNHLDLKPLAPLSVSGGQGLSGHFAGVVDGKIIVAGGCNFPNVPAADGGEKVFYDGVYLLENAFKDNENWISIGKLPKAVAYGVSVSTPQGLICLGGNDGNHSLNNVYLVSFQGDELKTKTLPSLPVALDNMAGCLSENVIYVAGGQSDGNGSNRVFKVNLEALLKGESWEEMPCFPGDFRLQPCMAVQSNAGNPNLYLMGGYAAPTESREGIVHNNGLRLDLKTGLWSETAPILADADGASRALIGAVCSVSGGSHLVFFGGVNAQIFEAAINGKLGESHHDYMSHPADWYRFNDKVLVYHTLTNIFIISTAI